MKKINYSGEDWKLLLQQQKILSKEILNVEEACIYLGIAKSYLYKLTHLRKLAFFRPNGKLIYFLREDLNNFLLKNRQKSMDEIENESSNYLINKQK